MVGWNINSSIFIIFSFFFFFFDHLAWWATCLNNWSAALSIEQRYWTIVLMGRQDFRGISVCEQSCYSGVSACTNFSIEFSHVDMNSNRYWAAGAASRRFNTCGFSEEAEELLSGVNSQQLRVKLLNSQSSPIPLNRQRRQSECRIAWFISVELNH